MKVLLSVMAGYGFGVILLNVLVLTGPHYFVLLIGTLLGIRYAWSQYGKANTERDASRIQGTPESD